MSNHTQLMNVVARHIRSGDINDAERTLVSVADTHGDTALAMVIEDMPANDLVAILRQFDSSHGSAIASVISPRKFATVIGLEKRYNEQDHERLKGMIHAVLFADESRIDDYLEEVGKHEDSLTAFRDYFIDRTNEFENVAKFGNFESNEIVGETFDPISIRNLMESDINPSASEYITQCDGEWMQIAWLLRNRHIETFADILDMIRRCSQHSISTSSHEVPVEGVVREETTQEEESAL